MNKRTDIDDCRFTFVNENEPKNSTSMNVGASRVVEEAEGVGQEVQVSASVDTRTRYRLQLVVLIVSHVRCVLQVVSPQTLQQCKVVNYCF